MKKTSPSTQQARIKPLTFSSIYLPPLSSKSKYSSTPLSSNTVQQLWVCWFSNNFNLLILRVIFTSSSKIDSFTWWKYTELFPLKSQQCKYIACKRHPNKWSNENLDGLYEVVAPGCVVQKTDQHTSVIREQGKLDVTVCNSDIAKFGTRDERKKKLTEYINMRGPWKCRPRLKSWATQGNLRGSKRSIVNWNIVNVTQLVGFIRIDQKFLSQCELGCQKSRPILHRLRPIRKASQLPHRHPQLILLVLKRHMK